MNAKLTVHADGTLYFRFLDLYFSSVSHRKEFNLSVGKLALESSAFENTRPYFQLTWS
jgi:hypothetical protein